MKKALIGILIIVVCIMGFDAYKNIETRNSFDLKPLAADGERFFWTDNSEHNKYDIKFDSLNGDDIKEVISKKDTYNMKIDSNITSGDFNLKIYNDNKVLFKRSGSVSKTITINKNDSKNVKIEIDGKKAKGNIKINLS